MNENLAPRPPNEELRAKAVVKTGLIDAPKPEMFQVYCDLAREISGFMYADFSLFDGEVQCNIANAGDDGFESGTKDPRHEFNICSYVLLDAEPLIMYDIATDPTWKTHPRILDGTADVRAYAGFPVINKDNYALGTLCISHPKPMYFPDDKIVLIKKISANIAHLLDVHSEQKEVTSQKILEALDAFQNEEQNFTINDFKAFLHTCADLSVGAEAADALIQKELCELSSDQKIYLTSKGRELQAQMQLATKPMKRLKLRGNAAESLIDEMFASLK